MTLWEGRFEEELDPRAWDLNASLEVDRRLASQDVRGSQSWALALHQVGVLSHPEWQSIRSGLDAIAREFADGEFEFSVQDEDIHTAVERRLGELIGPLAGKLHTGRSRNDQVATDFRLWLLDQIPSLEQNLKELQAALVARAEVEIEVAMPGYTHLQPAQPVLLSHWWLSHFWALQRDRERLAQVAERTAVLPLGSGALAGCPLPVDRHELARSLGFEGPIPNSLDAVSDRDFAAEFLFWGALLGVHLSRFSEALVVFSSAEFGYFQLPDQFATGSSLMPQKKNPDLFELARGKSAGLIGQLVSLLVTLKSLPSAYDKDLQEDKAPVFAAVDSLRRLLPALSGIVSALEVDAVRMRAAIRPSLMATDLADYLVKKSVPFREAHAAVGRVVRLALEREQPIEQLDLESIQALHPAFESDFAQVFDLARSLAARNSYGGTAPERVREQLQLARSTLKS
jgi:argininosuccinate lyase